MFEEGPLTFENTTIHKIKNSNMSNSFEEYKRPSFDFDYDLEDHEMWLLKTRIELTEMWARHRAVINRDSFLGKYPFYEMYDPRQFARAYRYVASWLKGSKHCFIYY